jgi:hypothetical protein
LGISSSGDKNLALLLEGKVLEDFVETLIVGVLLFLFLLFVVSFIALTIFEIELPSEGCENVNNYRWDWLTYRVVYNPDNQTAARTCSDVLAISKLSLRDLKAIATRTWVMKHFLGLIP